LVWPCPGAKTRRDGIQWSKSENPKMNFQDKPIGHYCNACPN
jgi:hypothetical protein